MIGSTAIMTRNGQRVGILRGLPGAVALDQQDLMQLAQAGIALIVDRVAGGFGSDDTPMPALDRAWERRKVRHGLAGIRDLYGTGERGGHMLDGLTITEVSRTEVRVEFVGDWAALKARQNEQRTPWFGWSPRDVAGLDQVAAAQWARQARAVAG